MQIKKADLPTTVNVVAVIDSSGEIFIYINSSVPSADLTPVLDYLITSTVKH